ncbi:MAG TPA: hypothetical protein VE967_03745 [Gemmatimonadaceae bacterium]|nr:hypothetical protein [Gemmatimonadaceae bacterium]
MLRRRLIHAFAFVAIIAAATACTDTVAPADDPEHPGTPCSQPAPEPGMTCRSDVWTW